MQQIVAGEKRGQLRSALTKALLKTFQEDTKARSLQQSDFWGRSDNPLRTTGAEQTTLAQPLHAALRRDLRPTARWQARTRQPGGSTGSNPSPPGKRSRTAFLTYLAGLLKRSEGVLKAGQVRSDHSRHESRKVQELKRKYRALMRRNPETSTGVTT